jgi:hypothetical protein
MRPCAWEGEGTRLKPPVIPAKARTQTGYPRDQTGPSATLDPRLRGDDEGRGKAPHEPAPSPQFSTIVTARRFSAQAASSDPCATGRSDP